MIGRGIAKDAGSPARSHQQYLFQEHCPDFVTRRNHASTQNGYDREHLRVETMINVRKAWLGTVFRIGGCNIDTIVAFVKETQPATWKLAARHASDILRFHALNGQLLKGLFLDSPENNFAYLQDLLMLQYGRTWLQWVAELPRGAFRAAFALRGRKAVDPLGRFSTNRLRDAGSRSESFTASIHYAQSLRPCQVAA